MVGRRQQRAVRAGLALAAAAGLGLAAASCQDTSSGPEPWVLGEVHSEVGLVGGHQQLACGDCHGSARLAAVEHACEACHLAQYDTTSDPDHRAEGYATTCADCHTSQAWRPAGVDHDRFGFPLEGAHARAVCAACHVTGFADSLGTDCWSCHAEDYRTAADPDHVALEFGTDCRECHSVEAWSPATFDHLSTGFPLEGAHAAARCLACHAAGYSDTPTACVDCHRADEPADHFGPDCAACHSVRAWKPSTFDHEPRFPIASGSHRRYRSSCDSCHLQAGDWASFTCTDCHDGEHRQASTDRQHNEVRRYQYDSAACYDCHPGGRGEGAEGGGD